MNEKRYFFSEKKGKFIECNMSHRTIPVLGTQTKQFKVEFDQANDFSEFYDALTQKEPAIKNGSGGLGENFIRLYSNAYLASVKELLPLVPSQQEVTSQSFQPVFVATPPSTTPSVSQNLADAQPQPGPAVLN